MNIRANLRGTHKMTDQVSRITAIDSEIKRLQNRIKELKIERSKSSAILLKTMDRTGKDEIGGIKRSKIETKVKDETSLNLHEYVLFLTTCSVQINISPYSQAEAALGTGVVAAIVIACILLPGIIAVWVWKK